MGALNLEETTLIGKKTYKAINEKTIVSRPLLKYERLIGENQKLNKLLLSVKICFLNQPGE